MTMIKMIKEKFNEKLEIKRLFDFEKSNGYYYNEEFIKQFTKAWKKSTPKIVKKIKKAYPKESEYNILKNLIECVDIDLTVQYGEYKE